MKSSDSDEVRGLPKWRRRINLSVSAFIMSLTATVISSYHALRGPIMLVRNPFGVVMLKYGDGSGRLAVAITIPMMNTTVGYSDVITSAWVEADGRLGSFPVEATVNQGITGGSDSELNCKNGSPGCFTVGGLSIKIRQGEILDLPGATKEVRTFLFASNISFDQAVKILSNYRNIHFKVHIKSYSDGDHIVDCVAKYDVIYLKKLGWVYSQCQKDVEPGRLF